MLNSSVSAIALGFVLSLPLSSSAMVNHLPKADGANKAKSDASVERKAEGLNKAIETEFSGVSSFGYWDHIGMVGMGSGVYLGDGHVLTSAHVGCFPFRMQDGSYYKPNYNSWHVLTNEDGSKSDLAVFDVTVPAGSSLSKLGRVPMSAARQQNAPVLLIGTGFTQTEQPISMKLKGNESAILGYRIQLARGKAWGINHESQNIDQLVATSNTATTHCFTTKFERTNFAGQAADGDSGGAAFCYNSELGRWELAGCIIAVSQARGNVTFGTRTFLGDLTAYNTQIPHAETSPANLTQPRPAISQTDKSAELIQARPASIR